ncbi:hypothetical protein A9O63_06390 [Cereibacter johrii]|uniref:Transposase IS116/IS110/IS902 family protein n=1 Tax=Cereibacter johrii TaxID=445629 RepID=A0ABX5J694_9RHOB|nr:hypothetical protein A9O63_06390 [Cereibacter johrii]PTM76858.1 transposase IS116/IS110/IS902 family protein [Cereibacter johrii]
MARGRADAEALRALRGVNTTIPATVVAEVGDFGWFETPRQLMAWLGLVPSEHSSGSTHVGRSALLQRQPRLGPVERLDLRFLVDAEHNRPVRRIEVEPHDLGDLLLEHRVVRDLEPLHDMRPTLEGDMPTASDIVARLQCVALNGVSCTVFAITLSRTSLGRGGSPEGRVLSRLSPGTPSS